VIWITPPQAQKHCELSVRAGWLAIRQVGDPGTQGPVVTGTHGIGVSTPNAAAVAEATVGLASEVHMANGGMLAIGAKSMIVAAGMLDESTVWFEVTSRLLGAVPNEQVIGAPKTT